MASNGTETTNTAAARTAIDRALATIECELATDEQLGCYPAQRPMRAQELALEALADAIASRS